MVVVVVMLVEVEEGRVSEDPPTIPTAFQSTRAGVATPALPILSNMMVIDALLMKVCLVVVCDRCATGRGGAFSEKCELGALPAPTSAADRAEEGEAPFPRLHLGTHKPDPISLFVAPPELFEEPTTR